LSAWTTAKKNFETTTKTKKPSEKFMGVFRKKSGIEEALQALDASISRGNATAATDAFHVFQAKSKEYVGVLDKAAVANASKEAYKAELKKLRDCLKEISEDGFAELGKLEGKKPPNPNGPINVKKKEPKPLRDKEEGAVLPWSLTQPRWIKAKADFETATHA